MPKSSTGINFHTEEEQRFGEWFYEQIQADLVVENSGWAFDSSQRVADRLNQQRKEARKIKPVVIWIPDATAFIVPGDYLYISRELLQLLPDEDEIAFLIAHEMAHHDLGHVRFSNYSWLTSVPGNVQLGILLKGIENKFTSMEHESQADKYGLDLCLSAGYDGEKCLGLFNVLEAQMLDFRDLQGVFGAEESTERSKQQWLGGLERLLFQTRQWGKQLLQSHPHVRGRQEQLQEYLRSGNLPINKNLGFKYKGIDVFSEITVTHSQAAVGCQVEIKTLDGFGQLTIPPETKPNAVLRLKHRGATQLGDPLVKGHHLITVQVEEEIK
jgi:Zn-dependent protease with chaperone function